MKILAHSGGVANTNCYVVADESTGQAVLFDAPDHTITPLLDAVEQNGWKLIGLWLTHGHFDHMADHALVKQRFPDAKILVHKLDDPKIVDPKSQIWEIPFHIPPCHADEYVEDGQTLRIGAIEVEVMHVPGHSPGLVAFYIPSEHILIGGDLIMAGSMGTTELPDADHEQMMASIRRVMQLPDDTRILSGHGPVTTVGAEKSTNPCVAMAMQSAP